MKASALTSISRCPQLTGSLLDRMHGVAKLHAAAKSALGEELTEVKKAEYDALKASQTNTGHSPGETDWVLTSSLTYRIRGEPPGPARSGQA